MTDAIYLTNEEIERLHRCKLEGTMSAIRDRFVIGCVTGMRFSDYSRFGPNHVQNGIISILTKKRAKPVSIPVHPFVLEILRRNKQDIPPANTLRYYNMMLPRIGHKAKIWEIVTVESVIEQVEDDQASELITGITTTTERVVKTKQLPKCELITTHTARRSFATNAYLAGIPVFKIMLITGHATEQDFFRYIRIGGRQNAEELKGHDFFKK